MFNPADQVPMAMFSMQHIIALIVVFAIIMIIFFCRKAFIKSKIADKIFRYSLAFILIAFELTLQFLHNPTPIFTRFFLDTYPLCGYMIWFTAFALITNSKRLMKIIYPFTILGGMLSLIVLDVNASFPHFGAIQFFSIHAGFMIGSLYFLFTQKITRYTLCDLKKSALFLAGIACYMLLICSGKLSCNAAFGDPFFILTPPGGLEFIKDALGQVGYTILYLLLIASLLFGIYGVTKLCTRKRAGEYEEKINFKKNILLEKAYKIENNNKILILFIVYAVSVVLSVLNRAATINFLNYINILCFFVFYTLLVLYELCANYRKEKTMQNDFCEKPKGDKDDK